MISPENPRPTSIESCTGCGACVTACPRSALSMQYDNYGHYQPIIDFKICICCNRCEKICPVNNEVIAVQPIKVIAASSTKKESLQISSSGGAFAVVADKVLSENGVVYGVAMDFADDGSVKVHHERVVEKSQISRLYGSKYTESEVANIYKYVIDDIIHGRLVFFVGTPCQVAAVQRLTKNPDNLVTADLVCHGVAPQKMFQEYITKLSTKRRFKIDTFRFRSKILGWALTGEFEATTHTGKRIREVVPCTSSSYYSLFLSGYIFRESCYKCRYATSSRIADLTFGDFWGVEKFPEIVSTLTQKGAKISDGVSCILINTSKGRSFISDTHMNYCECTLDEVTLDNAQLRHPSPKNAENSIVKRLYEVGGYDAIEEFIMDKIPMRSKLISHLKKILPLNIVRKILKA